ncbi:unnamed protein product, partial [Trichobilharzia regenti]
MMIHRGDTSVLRHALNHFELSFTCKSHWQGNEYLTVVIIYMYFSFLQPNHPVMSGPAGVSGPGGAGPGMPPPLGPPGPDPVSMRQRPSGPPLMPGSGL